MSRVFFFIISPYAKTTSLRNPSNVFFSTKFVFNMTAQHFDIQSLVAALLEKNGLVPVLADFFTSGADLPAVLDRLEGYAVNNPSSVL